MISQKGRMGMVPVELQIKVESLRNMLLSRATGGDIADSEYKQLRQELLAEPRVKDLLPRFIQTCRDTKQFWEFIRVQSSSYQGRREYLHREFEAALQALDAIASATDGPEQGSVTPADNVPSTETGSRSIEESIFDVRAWYRRYLDAVVRLHLADSTLSKRFNNEDIAKVIGITSPSDSVVVEDRLTATRETLASEGLVEIYPPEVFGEDYSVKPTRRAIEQYFQEHQAVQGSTSGVTVTNTQDPRKVFVIHGRNDRARRALFAFLRAIGLHPLEWSEAVKATGKPAPYVGEVLDAAFSTAQAVVVLMTPDDEARLREPFRTSDDEIHEIELTPQARPNVLFEAGMAMGRYPERTVLVQLGKVRPFSDIGGRHVVRLNNSTERRQDFAQRLDAAGCPVQLTGTDWHTEGDFSI